MKIKKYKLSVPNFGNMTLEFSIDEKNNTLTLIDEDAGNVTFSLLSGSMTLSDPQIFATDLPLFQAIVENRHAIYNNLKADWICK